MANLLTPIKTAKKVSSNIRKFESLIVREDAPPSTVGRGTTRPVIDLDVHTDTETFLKPVKESGASSVSASEQASHQANTAEQQPRNAKAFLEHSYLNADINSTTLVADAVVLLKSQPTNSTLHAIFEFLQRGLTGDHAFNVRVTGPESSQIVSVLISTTIPDIWPNLRRSGLSDQEVQWKRTIIESLTSATGLGGLVTRLRQLTKQSRFVHDTPVLHDLLSVLAAICQGNKLVYRLLSDAAILFDQEIHQRLFCQEISTLITGSRILNVCAECLGHDVTAQSDTGSFQWLGDGKMYTKWLSRNLVYAATQMLDADEEAWARFGKLFKQGLTLGYRAVFVSEVYTSLLLGQRALWTTLHRIFAVLSRHEQRLVFGLVLEDLARKCFAGTSVLAFGTDPALTHAIAGASALIANLVANNDVLEECLEEWLVVANASHAVVDLATRRALVAVLSRSEERLERVLDRALANFGGKLQLQHDSMVQQEAYSQTILLVAGCLGRLNLSTLKGASLSRSSMHAVSNRLSASNPRARFLGMVIGMSWSRVVDGADKALTFDAEEMDSAEGKMWRGLVDIQDTVGTIGDLRGIPDFKTALQTTPTSRWLAARPAKKEPQQHTSKIVAIEEVEDAPDEEDLVPYEKPDSDPEDSDDDPTLINRSKPSAPVYIVDLVKQLAVSDKPEIVELALKTAPSLIRRKAAFGSELSDHITSLATALINLNPGMSEADFSQHRLEALVSCFVTKPEVLGPSLASLYFEGDFSISQRTTILTTVVLGSRELAGWQDENSGGKTPTHDMFPSKRLPAHVQPRGKRQELAPQQTDILSSLTISQAHETIRPLALEAADQVSGPDAVKIRKFSSRLEVEKARASRKEERTKRIPKNLHTVLTTSVFLPLCSRMAVVVSSVGGGALRNRGLHNSLMDASMVKMVCQALTLVLHTLGPTASLQLPVLTHETLLLLSALQSIYVLATDALVLPALLHLLLAVLDITIEAGYTAQEMLITDHGTQVAELLNWVNDVSNSVHIPDIRAEDGTEDSLPWKVLAAGIQVKWFEMGKRFQGRMLGLTTDEFEGF